MSYYYANKYGEACLPCGHVLCIHCQLASESNTCPECGKRYKRPTEASIICKRVLDYWRRDLSKVPRGVDYLLRRHRKYFSSFIEAKCSDAEYAEIVYTLVGEGYLDFEATQTECHIVDKYIELANIYLANRDAIPMFMLKMLRRNLIRVSSVALKINACVEWLLKDENTISSHEQKARIAYVGGVLRGEQGDIMEAAREFEEIINAILKPLNNMNSRDMTDWMCGVFEKTQLVYPILYYIYMA